MKAWWQVLGVPRKSDRATIRRAYARKLRVTNPEDDPQGFMALREAYEAALRWVEYEDGWEGLEQDEAAEEEPASAVELAEPLQALERAPTLDPPLREANPLANTRAAEQEELRRRTAALDAALRGPWQRDAAALTAQLDAILAAPALIEIAVRDSVENWLADLLAETVPRSDPVLRQAIDAFGWEDEGNHPPGVWRILGRIDEWRVIQTLRDGDHALSAGWNALTRADATDWQRRISALRPGVAGQVRQLLGLVDYQLPGLAYSFDSAAAVWWRDHLAKPRLGNLDLTLILLGTGLAVLLFGLGDTRAIAWGGGAAALLLGIAVPMIRIHLIAPWRDRRELAGRSVGWPIDLWLALWLAAAIALILIPAGQAKTAAVISLGVAAISWMAMVETHGLRIDSPVGRILALLAPLVISGPALLALPPPELLALGAFVIASVIIDAVARDTIVTFLWRITRRPVLLALGVVAALLGVVMLRFQLPAPPPLIPFGAVAIAGMVLLAALRDTHDGSRAAVIAPWVRWGLWVMLVFAAIFSTPPVERKAPIATDPMAQLEQREPGFAALKTGNPGLHSAIALLRQQQADGTRTASETGREIDRLVNTAYRERLAVAPAALVAAEMDIRLATLREYRARDVQACASGEGKPPAVSEPLRARQYRHALTVAGSKPADAASRAMGREIPAGELLHLAANGDAARADRLAVAMRGSEGRAKCDARIAFLEALVAQDDADIAKTMRPALTTRAEPDSTKE